MSDYLKAYDNEHRDVGYYYSEKNRGFSLSMNMMAFSERNIDVSFNHISIGQQTKKT